MKKTEKLRKLLKDQKILIAPGAYDVLSAKIIKKTGFNAVYMTGYGVSASVLGQPDVGLLTMNEMVKRANDIVNAVNVPVIADADTGYGNPLNVRRTVIEYEKAGVAGIQLEDQVFPKKCGHMLGREVIPIEHMVQKIKAAVDVRKDNDFIIIARTDARTNYGLEEALLRGKIYQKAGADVLFIESPESIDEMKIINETLKGVPTLANMLEGGRTPNLTTEELEKLGFAVAIYCTGPLYVATKAVKDYLQELKTKKTTVGKYRDMISFEEFNKFIGLPEYRNLEEKYKVKGII